MSKIAKDFGSFVNDKCFDKYLDGKEDGVYEPYSEDSITDMFIEFTKGQQKELLKTKDYVKTWIDEWCDIFPSGVRSGGKLIKSEPDICANKMSKFLKRFPKYDRDLIFFATKEYIKYKALENFAYTRCATYFIDKLGVGSELAEWCDKCKNLDLTEEQVKLEIHESNDFI